MTDREVASTLREATRAGLIVAWIQLPNGDWTIHTQLGGAQNYRPGCARRFCDLLNDT